MQFWLGSVFSLAERVTGLAAATLSAKRRALERKRRLGGTFRPLG
ncbi:hypothetical protein [Methylobacterium oryzisoli]